MKFPIMCMTQFWIHNLAVEKDYPRRKEIVHKLIWIYLFQLPGHHLNELIFFGGEQYLQSRNRTETLSFYYSLYFHISEYRTAEEISNSHALPHRFYQMNSTYQNTVQSFQYMESSLANPIDKVHILPVAVHL